MKLTENPAPPDELVNWACEAIASLCLPADRPWYLAPPPPMCSQHWEYLCRCGRQPVRVTRHACVDGQGYIYIGQCRRCQTVIWSYQQVECSRA